MCVLLSNGVACPKATTLVGVALRNVCIASSGKGRSPAQGAARSAGGGWEERKASFPHRRCAATVRQSPKNLRAFAERSSGVQCPSCYLMA